jgi:hypothetical protein
MMVTSYSNVVATLMMNKVSPKRRLTVLTCAASHPTPPRPYFLPEAERDQFNTSHTTLPKPASLVLIAPAFAFALTCI